MLGELCAACLWKYVLAVFLGSGRWLELSVDMSMEWRSLRTWALFYSCPIE